MEFIAALHPKFVHFPIALFLAYTLFEIAGIVSKKDFLAQAAYILLLLSILGAVAAVLTGNQASDIAEKLADLDVTIPLGAISKHEVYANYAMWYMFTLAAFRTYLLVKKKFTGWLKLSFIALSLLGCLLIFEAALLGGKLVYQYGVGTEVIKPEDSKK
ncbi:MAG: DUF2231 domain-containing protein [Bacteroidota bacterium]|jgi:uncharacterized membrane protein|nr:hypothetical protein [Ignavibacteria bacterium]MCU7500434.1 hypothetical protein [Ignavibacteria bacterium]MCU7512830.1 hypothetical protein [Ignavibacteria bacterium]MCU7521812.1 hypothetical protein [Ignavibacteria bacterium]MCU7525970.1 hypothetical protein [Ignavibacteria bacterium]